MSKHGRILVAMSGGIDSTVAARMLHEEGYEVVGMTMKTWDYATAGGAKKETGCCSLDSINDARAVSVDCGFPHFIIDIRDEFGDYVIDDFVNEYIAGRTPNPCILCNTHIKWEALLHRADALGCEKIATGHYARIKEGDGRRWVSKAIDPTKDQSYVLWGLSQSCLERTVFPLGEMLKADVKQLALDWGYESLANKPESYEICFIPDNDYRGFLKRRLPELEASVKGGLFVNAKGEVLGEHEGYPFYTVGQRRGLNLAVGHPMYVSEIIPATNTVVLGEVEELNRTAMTVYKLNSLKHESFMESQEVVAKIRYRHQGAMATLHPVEDMLSVHFDADVAGVAPGQSAVFYDGDDVLGGGVILESSRL